MRSIILALIGSGILLAIGWFLGAHYTSDLPQEEGFKTATPGMDYLDKFTCPKTQNRIILINGKEDGYDREGEEPANIHPRLLVSPFFQDMKSGVNHGYGHREYDERGYDKHLVDYFEVPAGIVSGELVFRARPFGSLRTDQITLGDFEWEITHDGNVERRTYVSHFLNLEKRGFNIQRDELYILDLKTDLFTMAQLKYAYDNVIDYMNEAGKPRSVDLSIADDSVVDFAALALCQKSIQNKGVTFSEYHYKTDGDDISNLACISDKAARACDPHIGDTQCHIETPLACYRDGGAVPRPRSMDDVSYWVGGEVRLTKPVQGSQFKTVSDAHGYCASQFGDGWRVLDFHESGLERIISQSRIPAGTRAWIDIKTTSATCWARDADVQK